MVNNNGGRDGGCTGQDVVSGSAKAQVLRDETVDVRARAGLLDRTWLPE